MSTRTTYRSRKMKQAQFLLLQVELSDKAKINDRAWVYRALRSLGYRWNSQLQRWAKAEVIQT